MKKKLSIDEIPKLFEDEVFTFILGTDRYAISNYGRVYAFSSSKILSPSISGNSKRKSYTLQIDNKIFRVFPEKMVFEAFKRKIEDHEYVRPIDGNWDNLRLDNIKVTTVNPKTEDLEGRKIGSLLVLHHDPSGKIHKGDTRVYWKCQCDCGNIKSINHRYLINAKNPNCGCRAERPTYQASTHPVIPRHFWMNIMSGAKNRKIEFNLSIVDAYQKYLDQGKKCFYSGEPIEFGSLSRKDGITGSASLDRIDSTKGYTIDNVQWVHKDINWMKGDMSEQRFLTLCKKTSISIYQNPLKQKRVLVTGGLGFVGLNVLVRLKELSKEYSIEVLEKSDWYKKWKEASKIGASKILTKLPDIGIYDIVIHLAANSSTTMVANEEGWDDNVTLTQRILAESKKHGVRVIYASSGSVYGKCEKESKEGDRTFPLNFYGMTKEFVDNSLSKEDWENVYALRFFNVFGKFENNKGDMASVVHKWLTQDISPKNPLKLFKSTDPKYSDGGQKRDFVYAEDVCDVILHCMKTDKKGGIFNVGSGQARSWKEVAECILKEKGLPLNLITYIDMPESIRAHYQNFTQANIDKLRNELGYDKPFTSLEEGVAKTRAWMEEEGLI